MVQAQQEQAPEVQEARAPDAAAILDRALLLVSEMVPQQVTASELMTKTVFACSQDETMGHALQLMNRVQLKATPVVDGNGKLLGMLKYRDVMKAMHAGKDQQAIKAWMRREVLTVDEDTPYSELEGLMMEETGRLPVIDRDGKLLGIVTRTDVLRHHNLYGGDLQRRVA